MPKSTSRRTSLQPVFEPFDLLEGAPIVPPVPTNGYHAESLPDEGSRSSNGHHGELNGAAINGAAINGEMVNELDNEADLADLAAAKAAFAAEPISESPAPAVPFPAVLSSDIANQNDTASQNGHANLNGNAKLNGHAVSNGAAGAMPLDSPLESVARPPVSAVPPIVGAPAVGPLVVSAPVVGNEPVQHPAESSMEAPSADASSPVTTTREPHPASGSLFVPYLVTEIRELRDRRQRRRSWWRRIFG